MLFRSQIPLLLAFTGDYLIQGRLFTLPTQGAVLLGVTCIAAGISGVVEVGSPSTAEAVLTALICSI